MSRALLLKHEPENYCDLTRTSRPIMVQGLRTLTAFVCDAWLIEAAVACRCRRNDGLLKAVSVELSTSGFGRVSTAAPNSIDGKAYNIGGGSFIW